MTTTHRVANCLTLIGLALLVLVVQFNAYRSALHVATLITLLTATVLWTLVLRTKRRAR